MTELRILKLARNEALRIWDEERKRLERNDNPLTKRREQKALAELREISDMLMKAEIKEALASWKNTKY